MCRVVHKVMTWPPMATATIPTRRVRNEVAHHRVGRVQPMSQNRDLGLYPIVTSQCSSTTLYQVSYHIQWLFFLK